MSNILDYYSIDPTSFRYISHHGILGQKWGVRRYQNEDGTLTNAGKKHIAEKSSKTMAISFTKKPTSASSSAFTTVLNGTSGGGGVAGAVLDKEVESIEKELEELIALGNEIEGDKTTPAGFASKEYMAFLATTQKEMAALSNQYKAATDNAKKQAIVKEMQAKKEAVVKARKAEIKRNKESVGVSGKTVLDPKPAITNAAKNWLTAFAEEHGKKR